MVAQLWAMDVGTWYANKKVEVYCCTTDTSAAGEESHRVETIHG